MLRAFLLFLYASSALSDKNEGNASHRCILPPQPKNGRYSVIGPDIPNLLPGLRLPEFTLDVTCDAGYLNSDGPIYVCFEDGTTFGSIECLPECKREKQFNILSCGVGTHGVVSRCVTPSDWDTRYGAVLDEGECGFLGYAASSIISGGRIAERQEVPWHAGIYTKLKRPYMQICGGSLVSPTVVISAAHCFWNEVEKQLPASNYAVAVGKIYRPWNDPHDEYAQKSDVSAIKLPPRFQGSATNLQDDIALVIVSSPFSFTNGVRPVCLDFNGANDRRELEAGSMGKVAGWGLTSADGPASPILKVVELPVVDIQRCLAEVDRTFTAHITSDKICAGYQNGTAVCHGDSGGGLSFPQLTRSGVRHVLQGLVSGAPRSDSLCNTQAWATFTRVKSHQHFIRETVPEKPSAVSSRISAIPLATVPLQIPGQ